MSNEMVLEDGIFRMSLGYKGRALMNEMNALMKEASKELPCSHLHMKIQQEVSDPVEGPHSTMLAP